MSIEVEVKLKIEDKEQVKEKLVQLGFSEGELVAETDVYYTVAHHDFAGLDEALRIRNIENQRTKESTSVITYKGAKMDNKSMTRKELETEVGDADVCKEIFENIGFCPVPPVEKRRQYLQKENVTACVDEVKNLGDYLELEIIVDIEEEKEAAFEKLKDVLGLLGYSMGDTTRTSYLSMLMKK